MTLALSSTSATRSSFVRNCLRAATNIASFTAVMTICGSMPFSLLKISIDSKIDANLVAPSRLFFFGYLAWLLLPLELQVRVFHLIQRELNGSACRRL